MHPGKESHEMRDCFQFRQHSVEVGILGNSGYAGLFFEHDIKGPGFKILDGKQL